MNKVFGIHILYVNSAHTYVHCLVAHCSINFTVHRKIRMFNKWCSFGTFIYKNERGKI